MPAVAAPSVPAFDVKAATDAYLATVPPDKRARSDAYFEGGYWLQLWDFLLSATVLILLLQTRLSARIRDWAARISSWRGAQDLIYFVLFVLITTVIQFPLAVYEGYIREHKYGLATQTFGPWMRDQIVALAVAALIGGIAVIALYWVVRVSERTGGCGVRWQVSCFRRSSSSSPPFTSRPCLTISRNLKTPRSKIQSSASRVRTEFP